MVEIGMFWKDRSRTGNPVGGPDAWKEEGKNNLLQAYVKLPQGPPRNLGWLF